MCILSSLQKRSKKSIHKAFKTKLEGPRSLYSSPGYINMSIKLDNFGQKITNVSLVIADPLSKKNWAEVPPLM